MRCSYDMSLRLWKNDLNPQDFTKMKKSKIKISILFLLVGCLMQAQLKYNDADINFDNFTLCEGSQAV